VQEGKHYSSSIEEVEKDPRLFNEADLLPISRLADLEFCERRAALHLIEMTWEDNVHTVGGTIMHERVHGDETLEKRGDLIVVRGLLLRSLRLGVVGKADMVELHRTDDGDAAGATIYGHRGRWKVYPVEYKPGRLQQQMSFQIQLCAQALCLEEMLGLVVPEGAIYYGKPRRRLIVAFDETLRATTREAARRLHELVGSGKTPSVRYAKKCDSCSLFSLCMPKTTGARRSARRYMADSLSSPLG
jgi:CRISPR-associated exonuclease Cas4